MGARRWPQAPLATRPAPWAALQPPGVVHCAVQAIQSAWRGERGGAVAPMLPALLPAPLQAPKPFAAAQRLASSANGIAAAPRPVLAARSKQQQQAAAAPALEVVAADGPRGMKLKSRKARRLRAAGLPWFVGRRGCGLQPGACSAGMAALPVALCRCRRSGWLLLHPSAKAPCPVACCA